MRVVVDKPMRMGGGLGENTQFGGYAAGSIGFGADVVAHRSAE